MGNPEEITARVTSFSATPFAVACSIVQTRKSRAGLAMKTIESENGGYRSAPDMHTSLGEMASADNESQIASFFVGKSVFITGATGFMGKVSISWCNLFAISQ